MKNKLFSIFTALAMVLGILVAPFTSARAAGTDEKTKSVTVHKILQLAENLNAKDGEKPVFPGTKGLDKKEYVGEKIDTKTIEKYGTNDAKNSSSTITSYFGEGSQDIGGVYFAWAKKDADGKYYWIKEGGEFTGTKTAVDEAKLDNIPDDTLAGLTKDNKGIKFTTTNFKGEYKIYEIHSKSSYIGDQYYDADGNKLVKKGDNYFKANGDAATVDPTKTKKENLLTAMKAVPVEITLPLVNNDGVVTDAHVYPKNTEKGPEVDKNFGKEDNTTENKTANKLEHADKFDQADKEAGAQAGAKYENYTKTKETAKTELGKRIPYEVKTKIPANSHLATAKWDDKMTEGLTYNKDLVVKIDGNIINPTNEELVQTDNGFELNLKGDNLALLNGKDKDVEVELQYSANVNENAMADIPESNNVMFHYGNTPNKGTTPIPTNPSDNGELTVEKSWDDGEWKDGESATFELIDANTGKKVTAADLVFNEIKDETKTARDERLKTFEAYKQSFSADVTIGFSSENGTENNSKKHTWKYLDPTKEYIAKEIKSTPNSDAAYKKQDTNGKIVVVNYKSDNPAPKNPESPKVVLGGKRFVKTNEDGTKRLAGAEFFVKNSKGEYLVAKSATTQDAQAVNVATQKATLDNKVNAYNDADKQITDAINEITQKGAWPAAGTTIAGLDGTFNSEADAKKAKEAKLAELSKAIDKAQKDYNDEFVKAAKKYEWKAAPTAGQADERVLLVSDGQGRFEISGLEYGTYKLEEKTAPEGFAKLSGDQEFIVAKGTYKGTNAEFRYTAEITGDTMTEADKANNDKTADIFGQQIKNKKVTIPQTGGIGSLIFIVAGVAIMAFAFVAYKRSEAREA